MRHELESGAWVEMTPVQDLRGRDRDRYEKAVRFGLPVTEDGEIDVLRGVAERINLWEVRRDAAIGCFITAWSFTREDGEPLPVPGLDELGRVAHPEVIGDCPLDDETEIEALIAPYITKLRRPDPKETTTSSLNGRSRAPARSPKG
jgi:hypothetical protein